MTVFFFSMDDRVLTTFSTDWGKTAVDWLRMPYFSVMMSEYCNKNSTLNTGVKAKENILTVNISSAKPHSTAIRLHSHTQFKSGVFLLVIRSACPPNLKYLGAPSDKILIKNESSEHEVTFDSSKWLTGVFSFYLCNGIIFIYVK